MNEVRLGSGICVRWTDAKCVSPLAMDGYLLFKRMGYENEELAIVSYFKPNGDVDEVSVMPLSMVESHES